MLDKRYNNSNDKSDRQTVQLDAIAEGNVTVNSSIREIELYVDLLESKDFSDFMNRILSRLNKLGFSDYAFARQQTSEDVEVPLGNTPQKLMDIYFQEGLAEHDLVLDYALANNTTPIFQSTIVEHINKAPFDTETFRQTREVLKLNQSFGRFDNYIVPIQSHDGSGPVVFSITSKDMNPVDFQNRVKRCAPALQLLGEAIDYIGMRKFSDFFLKDNTHRPIVIHPRPLMLLNTLAKDNLSLTQAADKMCIGIGTVNKHVAAVKKAFGTRTIATAVYRAIKEGLIDCQD